MGLLRRLWLGLAGGVRNSGRERERLSVREAIALGALQGPTELLPVSSSAHTTLIPWLLGRPYTELDPELRKSFEVTLHAGAAMALALDMRVELIYATRGLTGRRIAVIALSLGPPALAGYALERPIERRLGGPRSIAAGLLTGAIAMALADMRPGRATDTERRSDHEGRGAERPAEACARGARRHEDAGPQDGLALGIAQAVALSPGVSRNGATLTAARARGFARDDAHALSWHAGLPVIVGASALKGWRLWRGGVPEGAGPALGGGAAGAFLSTAISARLLRRLRVSARSLLPFAIYRCTIAAIALIHLRKTQNMNG
jgi:undecaprenyl-diphosphatase